MAVDVCYEIASLVVSPRISFSHDLNEDNDLIPIECNHFRSDAFLLESTIDFDFCLTNQTFSQEQISSADELFSNGKILPVEVKKSTSNNNNNIPIPSAVSAEGKVHPDLTRISSERLVPIDFRLKKNSFDKKSTFIGEIKQSAPQALPHKETKKAATILENATSVDTKKKRLKEFLSNEETEEEEEEQKEKLTQARPFWQFRRSSSLNCENVRSNGLIRSSFQFLSRSNSTGSAPNPKQSIPKTFQKQNSQKEHVKVLRKSSSLSSSSSSSSSFSSSFNQNHHLHSSSKRAQSHSHPLKKSYSRSYGNGVKISPVLNLPPTYISKGTVCLFGLGSLFCNGKSKKKK